MAYWESKVKGDFCCIKVKINVKKTLQRGIFVVSDKGDKFWVAFKYENLPVFLLWIW